MPNNDTKEGDKNGEPRVYALVKGRSLDDEAREIMRQELVSTLARYGVIYQRDADAGVLPGDRQVRGAAAIIDRDFREDMKVIDPRGEDGIVNAFTVGRLKYPERFDLKGLEAVLEDNMKYWGAGLSFVVLVTISPLHRHVHRNHECIPSTVLAMFNDKVLVESWLVDKETFEIKLQNDEPRGTLFLMDTPEPPMPPRPGRVPVHDWESRPAIAAIPDGNNGVGGRTLIRTCALERDGYRGGDHPHDIKDISPETLGFVEEKSPNSLPMLVMANKVRVISATGGRGHGIYTLNLVLENKTDEEITVEVPAGSLFEVIDPKAAVQNLATAEGISIKMGPRSSRATMLNAFCANHRFAGPSNQPMRPTIFKMGKAHQTQNDTWNDLDNRGN